VADDIPARRGRREMCSRRAKRRALIGMSKVVDPIAIRPDMFGGPRQRRQQRERRPERGNGVAALQGSTAMLQHGQMIGP